MQKFLYWSCFWILAVLGSACLFVSLIPDFWLADSFGGLSFCCGVLFLLVVIYGGINALLGGPK